MTEAETTGARNRPGRPGWAWLVIVVCTLFSAWSAFATKQAESSGGDGDAAGIRDVEMRARVLVGRAQWSFDEIFVAELDRMDGGGLTRRHRVIVLAAELNGLDDARRRLAAAEEYLAANDGLTLLDEDLRVNAILHSLYDAPTSGEDDWDALVERTTAMSKSDRAALAERLGWIGQIAPMPPGTPFADERNAIIVTTQRATIAMFAFAGGGCCFGVLGLIASIGLVIGLATGKLQLALTASACPGGVLAEIFAAWFLIMTLPEVASLFAPGLATPAAIAALVFGFAALGLGRVHGIGWSELRRAIGLHRGTGLLRESAVGVIACLAAFPLVFVGFLGTALLGNFAERLGVSADASHPIIDGLAGAGLVRFGVIFVAAAIVAPVVEELFFRGVLYRHLRTARAGGGRAFSLLASGTASALVFAAVHPQPWVASPALGALGLAFALIREWRDSLVAPMVAHGAWNGTLVTLAWLVFA